MSVKQLRGRVQHKKKTEAEWYLDVYVSAGSTELRKDPFIPLDGEFIIFEKDDTHEKDRFKFGDGKTNVMALPFASAEQAQADWNQTDETKVDFIKNKTHGYDEQGNVKQLDTKYIPIDNKTIVTDDNGKLKAELPQADWNQMDETKADFIKNKPFGNKTTVTETKEIGTDAEVGDEFNIDYCLPLSATNIQIITNGLSSWSHNETHHYYEITSESSITIEKLPSEVITLFTFDEYIHEYDRNELVGSSLVVLHPNGHIVVSESHGEFDISYEKPSTLDAKYISIDNKTITRNSEDELEAITYTLSKYSNDKYIYLVGSDGSKTSAELDIPDWNENNFAKPTYIKNRTHYEYEGSIINYIRITTAGYSQVLPRALKPNTTYKIVINYNSHTLTTPSEETLVYENIYSAANGEYNVKVKVDKNEIKITTDKTITFSLYGLMIKQLHEKYLPIALHAGAGETSIVQNDGSEWVLDDGSSNWTNATHAAVFGNNNRIYETDFNGEQNGENSFIGGGLLNKVHSANSFIGGGKQNTIGSNEGWAQHSAIVGGS